MRVGERFGLESFDSNQVSWSEISESSGIERLTFGWHKPQLLLYGNRFYRVIP